MGKILEEMKRRRNEVKDERWRVSFRLARYTSGWIISECAMIRPESTRLCGRDASLEFQVGDGYLDGPVVQLFVRQRNSVLCARAKPVERMPQEGRKSLRPRLAIAKVAGSASNANRCWPKKAKRRDPEQIVLDWVEPENVTAPGIWLDLRGAEALRFQRLQTPALPPPLIDWLPGLDSGCCRLQGS
jgi:hypothetical protein